MSTWLRELWKSEFSYLGLVVKHAVDQNNSCISVLYPTGCTLDRPQKSFPLPFSKDVLITSCKGLICLVDKTGRICICNPNTGMLQILTRAAAPDQCLDLPPHIRGKQKKIDYLATGFGLPLNSNIFKVVRLCTYCFCEGGHRNGRMPFIDSIAIAEVYSLSGDANEQWRSIQCPEFIGASICPESSTYCSGFYYWVCGLTVPELIAFDFEQETFTRNPLPFDQSLSIECDFLPFSSDNNLMVVGYNVRGGVNLCVFWKLEMNSSSTSDWRWSFINRLSLEPAIVRPIHVQGVAIFFEKKVENSHLSTIVVRHIWNNENETLLLKGFYDFTEEIYIVSFNRKDDYALSNAQSMNGIYNIEDDGCDYTSYW